MSQKEAKKPKSTSSGRNYTRWSKDESSLVINYFMANIKAKKCPGKNECTTCINKYPDLEKRDWKTVKDFVRNQIVKSQRLAK